MNLQTKFNFLLFTAVLATAVPLIILGTLAIKDIVNDLNRQLLNKELEVIHSRVKETYRIVEKQGKMSLEESIPNVRVKLDDWLDQHSFGEKSHVFVIAADHTIISRPSLDPRHQVPKLEEMKDGKRGEFNYVFHGDDRFCMYNTFDEGDWLIAVSIDKKEMFGKQGQYFWLAS